MASFRKNPLEKKVPSNPRYKHVGSQLKTGKTIRDVEILSNQAVAKRKGELFRRIRCSTVAKLLNEVTTYESVFQLGKENEDFNDDVASQVSVAASEAASVFSVVNTEALGLNQETEFVILDLREPAEFEQFHIKEAVSFPAPNITRDRFPADVFRAKNHPNKFIIVYAWDERPGVDASQKFSQRGFDNVYLLSGGIEEFAKQFPQLIEGRAP